MATDFNGAKMRLMLGDEVIIATAGNEEWDKKDIASRPELILRKEEIKLQPHHWEFYLRRKNTYYFRSILGKIKVEAAELAAELKSLRYGEEYIIEY